MSTYSKIQTVEVLETSKNHLYRAIVMVVTGTNRRSGLSSEPYFPTVVEWAQKALTFEYIRVMKIPILIH